MSGHHIASNINFNDDLNDEEELIDYCLAVRKWPVYLLSGVFAFLALFIPVLLWRVLSFICCRKEPDTTSNCFSLKSPKNWLGEPLSSQTKVGRILDILAFILSIGSFYIYILDAFQTVEHCQKWSDNFVQKVDTAFNIFFLIHFVIRFMKTSDKLWFLLELYSFIDYLTVPQCFMSSYFDRTWIGVRFLRGLRILSIPDYLLYMNILETPKSLRAARLIASLVSLCIIIAGIIRLVMD